MGNVLLWVNVLSPMVVHMIAVLVVVMVIVSLPPLLVPPNKLHVLKAISNALMVAVLKKLLTVKHLSVAQLINLHVVKTAVVVNSQQHIATHLLVSLMNKLTLRLVHQLLHVQVITQCVNPAHAS
jgi:hypothetical protein